MTRNDRIEVRVAPETASRIKEAAALAGTSTSAFVVDAAADRAERILRRERETVVSAEYFERLLGALDEPARPNPALERGAQRARELVTPVADDPAVPIRTSSRRTRRR